MKKVLFILTLMLAMVACTNEERIVLTCTSSKGDMLVSRSDVVRAEIFSNGVMFNTTDGNSHTERWNDAVNCKTRALPK